MRIPIKDDSFYAVGPYRLDRFGIAVLRGGFMRFQSGSGMGLWKSWDFAWFRFYWWTDLGIERSRLWSSGRKAAQI